MFCQSIICIALLWALNQSCLRAEQPQAVSPRLLVVISVDQLCQDYLIRFQDNFSNAPQESIFNMVLEKGAWFTNCHHRQAFTYTAPGHAVQLTGAYPNTNGIIDNDWFDRKTGKMRYCVSDPTVDVIGVKAGNPMSPRVLLVDTVGDRLKLATNGKAKVIGVAIKDRAAILMAGHRADAAYWLEKNNWVTSTYYRRDLPGCLEKLNDTKAINRFRGQSWKLLHPIDKYRNQGPDENDYENPPFGFTSEFPHVLASDGEITPDKYGDQVLFSPFGNDYTLQAARELIDYEKLGADEIPDLLTINFSSNDYVGHAFGPFSLEVEDMTYRTDRQIADFVNYLDQKVGVGRWTLAITADHGVAPIPELLSEKNGPGEQALNAKRGPLGDFSALQVRLEGLLRKEMQITKPVDAESESKLILALNAYEIYLDKDHPDLKGDKFDAAQRLLRDWLRAQPYIAAAATRGDLMGGSNATLLPQLRLSFHPDRSGDVLFVYTPYCIPAKSSANSKPKGTTHGSPWTYDTHVPLLLIGNGITPGRHEQRVSPAMLAPTVSRLLGVDAPAGCVEDSLPGVLNSMNKY